MESEEKREADSSEEPEYIIHRIVYRTPSEYVRPPDAIPFHIPHKGFLEKAEVKEESLEPLAGFTENQNRRRHKKADEAAVDQTTEVKSVKRRKFSLSRQSLPSLKEAAAIKSEAKERAAKEVHLADQKELISRLRNDVSIGFLYMIYAATRDSEIYTPYCLKVVPFEKIDRHNFFTISANGVTHYSTEDMIFTPLDVWEREYDLYCRVVKIKTFKQFRMWKAYYVWRKSLVWKKYTSARNNIEKRLLILNINFQTALLAIQAKYFELEDTTFTDMRKKEENALFYFWENQMAKLEIIQQYLKELHIDVKQLMYECCIAALWNQGFLIDDANFTIGEAAKARRIRTDRPKMTYVDQANKRRFCERISCFICLVDYMMSNMLHTLLMNTLEDLCFELQTHYSYLPSEEVLSTSETDTKLEEPRPNGAPQLPMFVVDVLITTEEICFEPSEQIFMEVLTQLIELWHETVLSISNYLPDTYFNVFTEPMINAKQEERLIGYGPRLIDIIEENPHRKKVRKEISFYIKDSFEAAIKYLQRFHFILEFFQENNKKEHSSIKRERDIEKFRGLLARYHKEMDDINKMVEQQALGVLHLWFKRFKEIVVPSSQSLLAVVEKVLPWIGKHKIDSLVQTAHYAMKSLSMDPKTTVEYVNYLEFLENVQPLVEKMEVQMDYAKELYDLIEEYKVPCPPEDIANYLGFSVTATSLRNTVEKKVAETGKVVEKFTEQINKDFSALISEVGDIKDEASQPWLIDLKSNAEEAKVTLDALYDQLMETQKTANLYKSYQKKFRLEVTRFEMLDDVINSVRLRKLLWESLEDWDKMVEEYTKRDFSILDPDEINLFVAKNVKNINTFEKYIPPNEIVPKLKGKVQILKDKLPVITNLRNPSLKNRHWIRIENLLKYHFKTDEIITLELLENLDVFKYEDELQEISKQASSEASLEALLKEVEENWEQLEFIVLPYHDMKDVYILGGTDDVQQILDDSFIKVNTISSSKNVGPIKQRVDEWARLLDIFSSTLDELLSCQQSWLYLEPIFCAPDIQRQLPAEAKMFTVVDKSFKETMRRIAKMPLALQACTQPGVLEEFQNNNYLLEQIMKCLEAYLESKRVIFPRFYFLSNDELLEILAQTRNPFAVQPYLRKCFDAIAKLEFGSWAMEEVTEEAEEEQDEEEGENAQAALKVSTDILSMISPEGETVGLTRGLKVRGNIEDWLGKVEESMFISIRKRMIGSLKDYVQRPLQKWIISHPSQIVLTVSQIMWAQNVHKVFSASSNVEKGMKDFEQTCNEELNKLAAIVRGELEPLQRSIVCCLITIEVHARDNITLLVEARVTQSTSFEWLKQLRYYWDTSVENCIARMSNSTYTYGYEYLGASPRLVITPLTDKCYLCLLGALQLNLGGAPAGPAGTGKTETTKDLAKSMAIMCVVFNCSDGLDYKLMGRFFAGLAQSGGWCCFDEFNRIDIEVLSVIAQQLITIRNAKAANLTRFMFEGREIKLNPTCAAFITMNPGYAGRTELPDNLKALFRPVSMMVPDYGLIAEVILYSEGFESSHVLANKMVQMYKLCSEQLSQQDHYDFGMRAVKSVLVMAGSLKRANPDQTEDIVLINALCDSNLPKFLANDAELFQNIVNDLFPGVTIPEKQHGDLMKAIIAVMEEHNLQREKTLIRKVIQFNETMLVRHGVMLCGPTGGGKTTIINVLKYALTKLFEDKILGPYYRPVTTYTLNPKSVSLGELYGEVNPQTLEWRDGLLGITVRTAVKVEAEEHQWIICDGPVDAVWIENLNTALDDNKMVCLANSERIKFTPWVHMVFETEDLSHASPATVSRVGMVYVDPEELKWLPFVRTWISTLTISDSMKAYVEGLFTSYVEDGLSFIKKNCDYAIHQVDISKASMMCKLMESLIQTPGAVDPKADELRTKNFLCQSFVFSFLWSVGGNIVDHSREIFEVYVRSQFDEHPDARIPSSGDLWSLYLNIKQKKMDVWEKIKPEYHYSKIPFFDIVVPTNDTTKFGYIMELLLAVNSPVLFTGLTGVGKTIVAKTVLNTLAKQGDTIQIPLNFSAQTSSPSVQEAIEERLKKQKKGLLSPPAGKKIVIFADDVNMPKLETYGAQPPIELLRQYLDFHGLYDREKLFWKNIEGVVITAACAPPGGGRNPLTARFVRHFAMLLIPTPDETALKTIFKPIVAGFLQEFPRPVAEIGSSIVNASIEIYDRITTDLLPTPEKHHYVFNLRDLSKCVQGLLQADPAVFTDPGSILRLFYHESLRVFHDRLINKEDKTYFFRLMNELCVRHFNNSVLTLPEGDVIDKPPVLIFGDFMNVGASKENKIYEEIQNFEKLQNVLQEYLDDYKITYQKDVSLVFFMDAMEHITRTARILRVQRGNALLVGTAGMGKKSVTRLASHCCDYKCFQIELACNYDSSSFHGDLRKLYYIAGVDNVNTTFLMTDTEIVEEEFLEDINNILNSGEVPNLFDAAEDMEAIMSGMRPQAKSVGLTESNQEGLFGVFISRVKSNLHLVLCMSPVGDAFRRRCRMFPSLINCCTIDWFSDWPQDALLSVAQTTLKDIGDENTVANLGQICVIMHQSVIKAAATFYDQMRRRYYITPSNYLALIKLYLIILKEKQGEIIGRRERIGNGLKKLLETNSLVDTMKVQLVAFEPELKKKSADTEALMKHVAKEQSQADKVRQTVMADEAVAKAKAEETQLLADDAQKDLAEALPAMEAAMKALDALNKNDINEIKVFNKPPTLVKFVMEAVNLLLGQKLDWKSAKIVLGDMDFLKKLQEYDKDSISDALLRKLNHYVDNPDFIPEKVAAQSKACKSLCMWVIAIHKYAVVYRIVEPKRKKVAQAEKELNQIMSVLREKQQRLADVEAQIAALEAQYDASIAEKKNLEDTIELTANRLVRAGRLTSALGDEQVRWEQSIKDLNASLTTVTGDVLIAAGCVAYLGAFTNEYRVDLVSLWTDCCKSLKIPASKTFSLIAVLTDQFEIRKWNMFGLPRDAVSTENAIIVTKAERWPLMIDPQEQANQWIRHMENENGLSIIKLTDPNFMRVVENAIRLGLPVLLEEVGEILDPALNPVLLKATFTQAARLLIRLGDSEIEYDENFRLYVTTKLSNPHYLPETCIIVTLINFTVTPSGLEDQLLSDVVRLVLPELEVQRNDLISRISSDKNQLFMIEDKILQNLYASKGNILDDEVLIDSLNESKETAGIIAVRLVEAEETEGKITGEREKYRSVANRGSVLYFVVMVLGEIDPMYQFSLKYFNQIFSHVVEVTEKVEELEQYLQLLLQNMTLAVYMNVSRGLFERHKLVFSFMLCANILRQMGTIKDDHWNFLLRGPVGMKRGTDSKPDIVTLSPQMWMSAKYLTEYFTNFKTLTEEILTKIYLKIGSYEQTINVSRTESDEGKTKWNEKLDDFEKLMLIKALQEEKLVFAITSYVREKLGQSFVESPQISLPSLYKDMSCFIPLIFVLSTGSDPFGALHRFAVEIGCQDKLESISLGQGQGPIAEKMIIAALAKGEWVFLQNCHLATSWMLSMEKIVHRISEVPEKTHPDFRLFLSSMPSPAFPVSVLQNSVKVTTEPPKGLRANIKRAFADMTEDFFEAHSLGPSWRKMIFGICFFHAVIQERKKFGPLGWNITYEFTDSDRECAILNLQKFCEDNTIPWDALEYITGEIVYGGRVTDYWDLRCLKTILKFFFSPHTLESGYVYSASGTYFCPESLAHGKLTAYKKYIDELPLMEQTEIFGMHENANVVFQKRETANIINIILEVNPKTASSAGEKSPDSIVYELADSIMEQIDEYIDAKEPLPQLLVRDEKDRLPSLSTVIFQEVDRFNKLLTKVHSSLFNLQRAIKGFVVMSEDLEALYKACMNNQIPEMWSAIAYPSIKNLGSWIHDLEMRIDFIKSWVKYGPPISFWISGIFFPQGFLTGVLQTHARKYSLPIDNLEFDFEVKEIILDQQVIMKAHIEAGNREVTEAYQPLSAPVDGVLIHGLFLDAASWNMKEMVLAESNPGEMNPPMPVLCLTPTTKVTYEGIRYMCPLYKTGVRAGVLSTTGHSTNFVMTVQLPSLQEQSFWILMGTALLMQATD